MAGNSSTTDQSSSTVPWDTQATYLQRAFNNAQGLLSQSKANGPYTGDYVASPTSNQYNAANQAYNFGANAAYGAAGNLINSGNSLVNAGIPGTSAAVSGLLGNTSSAAGLVNNANTIASGLDIPGAVSAAMRDARTTASEQTLPSLYRNAAASGNINSDRTALAEGVVNRGLDNTAADLSATLRNSAYTTGLGAANDLASRNISALSSAGSLASGQTSAGLTGLASGISGGAAAGAQTAAGANAGQALNQSTIDNALAKFQGTNNYGWQNLSNYMNIVGGKSWGSSTTGTTDQQLNPSLLSTLGSVSGILGSLI